MSTEQRVTLDVERRIMRAAVNALLERIRIAKAREAGLVLQ